jgi:hypothetical protein
VIANRTALINSNAHAGRAVILMKPAVIRKQDNMSIALIPAFFLKIILSYDYYTQTQFYNILIK